MDIYQIAAIAGGIPMYLIGLVYTWRLAYEGRIDTGNNTGNLVSIFIWPVLIPVLLVSGLAFFVDYARSCRR